MYQDDCDMFSTYQVNNKHRTNLCFIVISVEKSLNKIKHEQKGVENGQKKDFYQHLGAKGT